MLSISTATGLGWLPGLRDERVGRALALLHGQPARLLSDGAGKVAVVAREVGYDSEAAFSRAFKRVAGTAPAAWRAQTREHAEPRVHPLGG